MHAESAYVFRHALLRDAAYQLQLPGDRARLHALAFEVIEGLAGGRPPEPERLDTAVPPAFRPHSSDPFAAELAEHAAMATGGSMRTLKKLYLRRSAESSERAFEFENSERAWKDLAKLLPGADAGEALRRAGIQAASGGRPGRAELLYDKALACFRRDAERRREGIVLDDLAQLYQATGRIARAERTYGLALEIHRRLGDRDREGIALGGLAGLYHQTGRVQASERAYVKALAIHRQAGNRRSTGVVLENLANLHQETGRLESAEQMYGQALALHRKLARRRSEGMALGRLAGLYLGTGRIQQAEKAFLEALAIHREVGNRRFLGVTLGNLSSLRLEQGNLEESARLSEQALGLHREVADRASEGVELGRLADDFARTGQFERAQSHFDQALAIHLEVGNRRFVGIDGCAQALMLLSLNRVEEARETWMKSSVILRDIGDTTELARVTAEMRPACARSGVPPFDEIHA